MTFVLLVLSNQYLHLDICEKVERNQIYKSCFLKLVSSHYIIIKSINMQPLTLLFIKQINLKYRQNLETQ